MCHDDVRTTSNCQNMLKDFRSCCRRHFHQCDTRRSVHRCSSSGSSAETVIGVNLRDGVRGSGGDGLVRIP